MSLKRLRFHAKDFKVRSGGDVTDVRLYGVSNIVGTGYIGNAVPEAIERLNASTSATAFDFLTISLAVTAADSFFDRAVHGGNGWARELELEIPLVSPGTWSPLKDRMEQLLRFLTGDSWRLKFTGDGRTKPSVFNRATDLANLAGVDCVSLFSGGLDSWIGVKNLLRAGHVPLLVSHAYRGDAQYQNDIYKTFSGRVERFSANFSPTRRFNGHDTTMRSRSLNFIALAAVAADAVSRYETHSSPLPIYVPENGFIALNAPLTPRRLGTLSTRTTHPHYLASLQAIFDAVGIQGRIENPYRHATKGRMIRDIKLTTTEAAIAVRTVSCGKWKRKGQQCGSCVPCIIRRASFFAAGIADTTPYTRTLKQAVDHPNPQVKDDVMSLVAATQKVAPVELQKRALRSGPLPDDAVERAGWFDVHGQGLYEVAQYLRSEGLTV